MWGGSKPTCESFLEYGPFTHVEAKGIPLHEGAYVVRSFFDAVFQSFLDHHKISLGTRALQNELRQQCSLIDRAETSRGPRLPSVNEDKVRMCVVPAFRLFLPLWACIAQGLVPIPAIPKSKTYYLGGVWWKQEYAYKLSTTNTQPELVAELTNNAFSHLSALLQSEITSRNVVTTLQVILEAEGREELDTIDSAFQALPSPKRLKTSMEECAMDEESQLTLELELAKMRGGKSTGDELNVVRRRPLWNGLSMCCAWSGNGLHLFRRRTRGRN